jgi:hypothetical protein
VSKSGNGHELGGLAGRSGNGGDTTLKGSHALLENIDSRLDMVSFMDSHAQPGHGHIRS